MISYTSTGPYWIAWLSGLCDLLDYAAYWIAWLTGLRGLLDCVAYWIAWLNGLCGLLDLKNDFYSSKTYFATKVSQIYKCWRVLLLSIAFFIRHSLLYSMLDVVYLANIQLYGIKKNFSGKKVSKTNKRGLWVGGWVGGGGGGEDGIRTSWGGKNRKLSTP